MAGRLLAARLFNNKTHLMSYRYVPTTVFTPIEYGCCGYSEEEARKVFGNENVVAYGSAFKPLEWTLNYEREDDCYAKLVTLQNEGGRVVGFHYVGPHAGEVTQGFAALMLKGATK
jgi:pyruvate/2-oxoglutarate dehydrogenase complex dihydrolipoamide dehydrogenase (E3) component